MKDTMLREHPTAEFASHADMSKRKRKRKKTMMGAAPEVENSGAGNHEVNDTSFESPKPNVELSFSQRKKKNKQKKRCKTNESNDKSSDLSAGTSLMENSVSVVDPEQELDGAQRFTEGISSATNSENPELNANLCCSQGKKKKNLKRRCKARESNDEICGNDNRCDLSVVSSPVDNTVPVGDPSLQHLVAECSEQAVEVPQPQGEVISTTKNIVSPKPNADLSCSQKKKKKSLKRRDKTRESNDESCASDKRFDLSVVSSSVENVVPGVDPSLQPPVTELSKQELEVPQLLVAAISRTTNSESSKPNADFSSQEKKKKNRKRRHRTHESNDESCGSDKRCDLSFASSSVENIVPGVDPSLQPPIEEFSEQELEVPQPLVEGISTTKNSESPTHKEDLILHKKKKKNLKKRRKTHESNDESCASDKICDLSVVSSSVENVVPGVDPSLQPPVTELSKQELEVPQPLVGAINTTANSENSKPNADFSSQEKKKKNRKRGRKTHESNDESCGSDKRCDLSVASSSVENTVPGVDPSLQPPVKEFSEQELEIPQPLVEGISTTTNSESPTPNEDLSLHKKKKKNLKRRGKTHESNDESCASDKRCDLSVVSSSVETVVPGVDPSLQPPVTEFSKQELEVPQPLMGGINTTKNSESSKPNVDFSSQEKKKKNRKRRRKTHEINDESCGSDKRCDLSVASSSVENIVPGVDPSLQSPVREFSEQELEVPQPLVGGVSTTANSESSKPNADFSSQEKKKKNRKRRRKTHESNDESCGSDKRCHDEEVTDTVQIGRKIEEVHSLSHLAIKADVDVDSIVKEDNVLQMSNFSAERSLVASSKKKLLILDVNGLLADIVQQECFIPDRYKPDIIISRKAVFKRPFCDDFLQFCFDRFNVGVWSSRTKRNVDMVINFLLGDSRHKLLFCWNQSHCTTTRYKTLDNKHKPLVLKELRKLWEKLDPDLPWVSGEYNESNTLLLDDSPYKALRNPVNTAIFPYSYQFRDDKDTSLGPGGDIRSYLEGLALADNVQNYVEQNPFGQLRITKSNPSWSFYHRVIEDVV